MTAARTTTTLHRTTLENGLTVVGEANPRAQSFAAAYFVRAGAWDEGAEVSGVSHFLEHMAFKGSDRRSAADINRGFDELGARNNAYTSEDHTVYYAAVLPEKRTPLLDLLTDLLRPSLRQEDFEVEKKVILEEIAMYADRPSFLVFDEGLERFYDGHPAGNSILGSASSIAALTRGQMAAYFEARYAPDNVTLVLTGAFDFDEVVRQVAQLTKTWTPLGAERLHPPAVVRTGRDERTAPQLARTHAALFAPGYAATDRRRYAAALIASCLGDTGNGRLYWELVDSGLADSASLSHDAQDGVGAYVGYVSTAPERSAAVLDRVHEVLEEAQREGFAEDEWTRTQRRIATGLTLSAETPFGRLMPLGRDVLYRSEVRTLQDIVDDVLATGLDDAHDALSERPFDRGFTYVIAPEVVEDPTVPEPGADPTVPEPGAPEAS